MNPEPEMDEDLYLPEGKPLAGWRRRDYPQYFIEVPRLLHTPQYPGEKFYQHVVRLPKPPPLLIETLREGVEIIEADIRNA